MFLSKLSRIAGQVLSGLGVVISTYQPALARKPAVPKPELNVGKVDVFLGHHLTAGRTIQSQGGVHIASGVSYRQVGRVVASQLERQALAPTGKLRVGVVLGHPTHFVRDASGEVKGVTYDLSQELAKRLGVPVEIVEFPLMAGVFNALRKGDVDFTLARPTPARTKEIDFSPTILNIECGYLVRPGSGISSQDGIDRPGVRVGVTAGGVIHETLTRDLKSAVVIPTANMTDATKMFASGTIDAFAANKSILFEMADQTPESRVLDGRWGEEAFAVAIPKGREQGARFLRAFLDAVRSDGLVQTAADRTHMRGIIRD